MIASKFRALAVLSMATAMIASADAQSNATSTTDQSSSMSSTNASSMSANGKSLSHGDRSFIMKAAKSGMKEVAVSQAVLPNAMDPSVKNFAQTMVTDHTAANSELMSLAQSKGVMLPTDDDKLSKKWTTANDDLQKDYVKEMISDHKDAVKLFEKGSKADDPDVAAFAQKTLPKLQHHLEMAEGLKAQMR